MDGSRYQTAKLTWDEPTLYAIYVVFVVAVIVRYVYLAWRTVRGSDPDGADPMKAGSGL